MPVHHTDKGFRNPHNNSDRGLSAVLKWQFGRGPQDTTLISPSQIPRYLPTVVETDLQGISNPDSNAIQVTWVGHATFLIQVAGFNILTDPMFSDRCSPVSFVGPKRVVAPGIDFDALPPIDAVVISHDHYDHLDARTIERLGPHPKYFVPLGIASWLADAGIENATELDWWQTGSLGDMRIHCVPAQHFSGRSLFNRNSTLWAGWVIESGVGNVYFAGDTGYSPDFRKIGQKFGPIKLSMIPIGAYRPRWFMGPVHVDPPQAIQIHKDVQSENSIGMHWGTFSLADEALAEPAVYLDMALRDACIDSSVFRLMAFGETRVIR